MHEITDEYYTIAEKSGGLYKEKGSKFIALAYPVADEDEIKVILESVRKEYHDARHHCYAYRLGVNDERYRVNDDGEPSGTAGRPIYGQILSRQLTNILIIVVRYFGGIKLGSSGLANAYKAATRDALELAKIKKRLITEKITIRYGYPLMNEVMRKIKENNLSIVNQDFKTDCELTLEIRLKEKEKAFIIFEKIHGVQIE